MLIDTGKHVHNVEYEVFRNWLKLGSVPANIKIASEILTSGIWKRAGELESYSEENKSRFFFDIQTEKAWGTLILIFILSVVWVIENNFHSLGDPVILCRMGALVPGFALSGEIWRIFSSIFLHSTWIHFGINITALWVVGRILEKWAGRKDFLVIFFSSAMISNILVIIMSLFHHGWRFRLIIGSSAGLLGAASALLIFIIRFRNIIPGREKILALSFTTLVIFLPFAPLFRFSPFRSVVHGVGILIGLIAGFFLEPEFCTQLKKEREFMTRAKENIILAIPTAFFLVYSTLAWYNSFYYFREKYLVPGQSTFSREGAIGYSFQTPGNWKKNGESVHTTTLSNPISLNLSVHWDIFPDTSGAMRNVFDKGLSSWLSRDKSLSVTTPEFYETKNGIKTVTCTLKKSSKNPSIIHLRSIQAGLLLFNIKMTCNASEFMMAEATYISCLDSFKVITTPTLSTLDSILTAESDTSRFSKEPFFRLSALREFNSDYAGARQALEPLLEDSGVASLAKYQWARLALKEGTEIDRGRKFILEVLRTNPSNPDYLILSARYDMVSDETIHALLKLRTVAFSSSIDPLRKSNAFYLLGMLYADISMNAEAVDSFKAAVEAAPESKFGHRSAIALKILSGKY